MKQSNTNLRTNARHLVTTYEATAMKSFDSFARRTALHSLFYAEACSEFGGPVISASLRPRNTAPFEEMSEWWLSVDNTVADLTGRWLQSQTSRSRDKGITTRPKTIKKFIAASLFDVSHFFYS